MRTFKPHFHMMALLIFLTAGTVLGQSGSSRTPALPQNLRHLTPILGTNPQPLVRGGDAPNCWNWALYITNGLQSLHFTDNDVFDKFLTSSFCRPFAERTPRAGLIGVIKTLESDTHLHAFYTLSSTQVLTRTLSYNPAAGAYEISALSKVRSDFHRPMSDPQCENNTQEQSICGSTLTYYACQFPANSELSAAFLQMTVPMGQLESQIEEYFLNRSRQTPERVRAQEDAIKQKLLTVTEGLLTAWTSAEVTKITVKEKELLRLRLQSLLGSLLHLGMPQEFYPKRQQLLDILNRTP